MKTINWKDEVLLNEAIRRITQFKKDINDNMLGLGLPSEYGKSKYFTPYGGRIRKRVLNWWGLSEAGKEYVESKLNASK